MQPQAVPSALRTSVPMQQRSSGLVPLARDSADTWRQATSDDLRRSVHFPLEHQPAAPAQHLAPASAGWTSHEVPVAKSRDFQLQPLEVCSGHGALRRIAQDSHVFNICSSSEWAVIILCA